MSITFRRRTLALGVGLTAIGAAAFFGACTDSYNGPHATGGGTSSSNATASTGTGGMDINLDGGTGGSCDITCSNDLKSVVDCKGNVMQQCPPEQGCASGMCMDDPCKAAELSQSSYGCDYWALKTAQRLQADGACFAVFVANTWGKPVHINVERDGQPLVRNGQTLKASDFTFIPQGQGQTVNYAPYDDTAGLGIGEVAVLFLSRLSSGSVVACPKLAALDEETGVNGTGLGKGFHVTTDYPVVAYQMVPYGGGQAGVTSATLLLPTSAWDKNYVAINAYGAAGTKFAGGLPSLDIIATKDNTTVTLLPKVDIAGGTGVMSATANTPVNYTLAKAGDFLEITQSAELTGSIIESDNPVGVFGASACMQVPLNDATNPGNCDSGQQQIAPVRALGSEYVAARYRGRGGGQDEEVPWRIVGAVDGTTLSWEPSPPPGAPKSIALGQTVEFSAPGPFTVKSQDADHPFYLGGYMTGGAKFSGEGDPDWVNVIPPQQYLNHYVLFTDPTYPETNLVVVRAPSKVDGKFAEVTLDCAGGAMPVTLSGWQPIGSYEYTRVDVSTGDFTSVNGCTNGRQELSSTLPFGVTVWGWGATTQTQFVSYAYPAGAGFQPINTVKIPAIPR